jgi:hypothetical protein
MYDWHHEGKFLVVWSVMFLFGPFASGVIEMSEIAHLSDIC